MLLNLALFLLAKKCPSLGRDVHTKQPSLCYEQLLRVFSTIININRPDGVFVLSNGLRTEVFATRARGFCDCWKLTFYVANI